MLTKFTAIQALSQIRSAAEGSLSNGVSVVRLVLHREAVPRSDTIRLCAERGGPPGKVEAVVPSGDSWKVTALFRAKPVAEWCSEQIVRICGETAAMTND